LYLLSTLSVIFPTILVLITVVIPADYNKQHLFHHIVLDMIKDVMTPRKVEIPSINEKGGAEARPIVS
jgi:hypothetical protein